MKAIVRKYIKSWDFIISVTITLVTAFIIPNYIKVSFAEDIYSVGITVLSIIFSLFFAASAIIMSSSDNDFIDFLEEEKHFSILLETFRFTLISLFVSLIYSIVLYIITDYLLKYSGDAFTQNKVWFLIFELTFIYSMLATGLSVLDTVNFSKYRSIFLKQAKDKSLKNG
jgi:hypothetical protein